MVLIESHENEEEILVKDESKQSCSSFSQSKTSTTTAEAKHDGGDNSDGFETASEREMSDNEGEEDEMKNESGTSKQPQQLEKLEKKEEQEEQGKREKPTDDNILKEEMQAEANEAKVEGNKLFGDGLFEEALSKYELALQLVQELPEFTELRSICHSNRAICFLKLGKFEETIKECTKALELNPNYVKALTRRAEAHEKLEHFEEAIIDLKKILELDPSNDQARRGIRRLEPLAAEKREKMKEEAIAKLKEMGNSILGRFGMNIDNFKAVKDPNTGSYSISFQN